MSTPSPPSGDLPYIPSTIPYDECRKFYDCEKHSTECPSYKEYIDSQVSAHTGTTSAEKASVAAQMQIQQLQQLAVCVEKLETQQAKTTGKYQQAAFLMSTLWGPNDTIKISFMLGDLPPSYPGDQPQWDGKTMRPQSSIKPPSAGQNTISCSTSADCKEKGPQYTCSNGQCVQDIMPLWYTRDLVNFNTKPGIVLSPEDEDLEKRVRAMDPIEAIKTIVRERLQPLVGLKLEFVESDGDVRISLDNRKGSWSYVGIQSKSIAANEPTMNFGWLDVATIIHEFCHALGMIHEHQNPYGKGIDWNLKKVFAWANATQGWNMYTTCSNITKRYSIDIVNGSNYDPDSIMLYSYPADLTNDNKATYRNVTLSASDKLWLQNIYPKEGKARSFPNRDDQSAMASSASEQEKKEKQKKWMYWGVGILGVCLILGFLYSSMGGRKRRRRR